MVRDASEVVVDLLATKQDPGAGYTSATVLVMRGDRQVESGGHDFAVPACSPSYQARSFLDEAFRGEGLRTEGHLVFLATGLLDGGSPVLNLSDLDFS